MRSVEKWFKKIQHFIFIGALSVVVLGCGDTGENSIQGQKIKEEYKLGSTARTGNISVSIKDVQFTRDKDGKLFANTKLYLENEGNQIENFLPQLQVKLYNSLGELQRQVTEGDKGEAVSQIKPGQKLENEIAWEISNGASELQLEFNGTVLVRKLGEDLVNGPVTVISQRRSGKVVYFNLDMASSSS